MKPLRAGPAHRGQILAWMRDFYREDCLEFDENRAAAAVDALLAEDASVGDIFLLRAPEGTDAGYLVLTRGFSLEFAGPFLLLDELYLAPEHRGCGLARAALEFAETRARALRCACLRLEVHTANTRACELYRRAGYSSDERLLLTKWM